MITALRTRSISAFELMLFCLFVGSYVFDFRSEEPGGHWAQYMYLVVSTISFLMLFVALSMRQKRSESYEVGNLPMVLAVMLPSYAFFGAVLNDVSMTNFLRLELRYVLFLETVLLIYMMARAGLELRFLIDLILITALISIAWSVFHTLEVHEYTVRAARHRLAPIYIVGVIGICSAAIFTGRLAYVIPLFPALYLIQLSSTRSYLVALGAVYVMMHVYAFAGSERRKLVSMAIFDLALLAFALYLYDKGAFDNWVQRFIQNQTGAGDASLLARLAEYQSQWDILTSSWGKTIFGAGLGSTYIRDLGVMRFAILSHHVRLDEVPTFEFGHSLWIYSAYYGGILGGWMLPFAFVAVFVKSLRNSFRSHRSGDKRRYLLDLQCNAMVIQVIVTGLLAHPFGSRLYCIHFGIVAAITFIYPSGQDTPQTRKRRKSPSTSVERSRGFT